jgi:formiminoglutamase
MNKLPIILSVSHVGLRVPDEVRDYCILKEKDIIADGDEHASEIYWPLAEHIQAFLTTDVARAIVDLNRAEVDIRKDGVIKTHTCWDVPVYSEPLSDALIEQLLDKYHRPYHKKLKALAQSGAILGVDGHTMAAFGPPVGPDTGKERPPVCLSEIHGNCPPKWKESLVNAFQEVFGEEHVKVNEPFTAGYITRHHSAELPWVQIELSRAPYMSDAEKSQCVLKALRYWCALHA